MIVKNEAKGIERTIKSVRGLCDEIVIGVDRQSKDKTLEIAKKHGDIVYQFDFIENFAKLRNEGINKATGDWILVLDGHEYVERFSHIDFDNVKEDAIRVSVQMESGTIIRADRLFKSNIRYKHAVHNVPDIKSSVFDPNFLVIHDRSTQDLETLKARQKQRDRMMTKNLEKRKDIRSLYYLAQNHKDMKRWKKAAQTFEEYLRKSRFKNERRRARYELAKTYSGLKRYRKAIETLNEDLTEFCFLRGQIYFLWKKFPEAVAEFLKATTIKPIGGEFRPAPNYEFELWDNMSVALFSMAQYEMAIVAANRALMYNKDKRVMENIKTFNLHLTANKERDAKYYDGIFKDGYDTSRYQDMYEMILRELDKTPNAKVLEIGCGVGSLGKMIMEKGYGYEGFDFSREAIKQCKKIYPRGNFRVGNAYDKKEYKGSYNVVVATEVLEHLDDLAVVKNIPSGVKFIASVPVFGDVSHLRTYEDRDRDIVKRFKGLLNIRETYFSQEKGIWVFIATKK
jgi:glycosyltransferase involved in cell wall biosynthesis